MYNTTITHICLHCNAHWQMVVILPKENLVVWFCSLHNRPNNYLKGIINRPVLFSNTFALALLSNINILMFLVFNRALKGLDDTPQPKFKAGARWIVVKVTDLKKTYTYIYILCVCTLIVVNV